MELRKDSFKIGLPSVKERVPLKTTSSKEELVLRKKLKEIGNLRLDKDKSSSSTLKSGGAILRTSFQDVVRRSPKRPSAQF